MSDIAEGKVGPVGYDLELNSGKLVLKLNLSVEGVASNLSVELDSVLFLDKLKALIPGQIDDAVIDGLKAVLAPKAE